MGIAIATTTFTKDASSNRAKLAVGGAKAVARRGYSLYVVDGGSPVEFTDALSEAGAIVFTEVDHLPGILGPGRRQALQLAGQNAEFSLWTEPEKLGALASEIERIIAPLQGGSAALVIPSRTDDLASYPPEQRLAELFGNLAVSYMIGRQLDIWFGPMAMNQVALQYFLNYAAAEFGPGFEDKWDCIHVPRFQIIADGHSVVDVPVNYTHPAVQTAEEIGDLNMLVKRIDQLRNLVPAFLSASRQLGLVAA